MFFDKQIAWNNKVFSSYSKLTNLRSDSDDGFSVGIFDGIVRPENVHVKWLDGAAAVAAPIWRDELLPRRVLVHPQRVLDLLRWHPGTCRGWLQQGWTVVGTCPGSNNHDASGASALGNGTLQSPATQHPWADSHFESFGWRQDSGMKKVPKGLESWARYSGSCQGTGHEFYQPPALGL